MCHIGITLKTCLVISDRLTVVVATWLVAYSECALRHLRGYMCCLETASPAAQSYRRCSSGTPSLLGFRASGVPANFAMVSSAR